MIETLIDRCPRLETERLVLRKCEPRDLDGFIRLNTDQRVYEFFRSNPSLEDCEKGFQLGMKKQRKDGFGFAVMEDRETGSFLGFCGLEIPSYDAGSLPFEPCVEIGWRLLPEVWGRGITGEASRRWLRFGFEILKLDEVVAYTVVQNHKSRRVMEKLGMTHDPAEDFDFPNVDQDHPLCRHVLYRLSADKFHEQASD
ncbi:putative ribosomal N-acetyltransferase YdaF [Pseudovibrio sp. W64]|uniref:GNAT family N-acetyltransferase n=1 Tax=Pseudovibrio sp. W64 TaxID=1735583 RepID=UPI0007B304A5|nr:GNAT family N-acetyltransferase [Pseudovibrio sp. W64]KZK80956.1 putative ribosomal N-acetyltransferase YdaF [Pseudovibrio sp. W64]